MFGRKQHGHGNWFVDIFKIVVLLGIIFIGISFINGGHNDASGVLGKIEAVFNSAKAQNREHKIKISDKVDSGSTNSQSTSADQPVNFKTGTAALSHLAKNFSNGDKATVTNVSFTSDLTSVNYTYGGRQLTSPLADIIIPYNSRFYGRYYSAKIAPVIHQLLTKTGSNGQARQQVSVVTRHGHYAVFLYNNGKLFQQQFLQLGLAFLPNLSERDSYQGILNDAQNNAQVAKINLWQIPNIVANHRFNEKAETDYFNSVKNGSVKQLKFSTQPQTHMSIWHKITQFFK